MKTYLLYFTLFLWSGLTGLRAQQVYGNRVKLQNVVCEQKDGQLSLRMNIDAAQTGMSGQKELVLTPLIKSDQQEKLLPPVVISGSTRYKANRRLTHFGGKLPYSTPYIMVKSKSDAAAGIAYNYSLAFEPWMETAHVELLEEVYGCATCRSMESQYPLAQITFDIVKPEGKPLANYIEPVAESVKNRSMTGQAYLDFPVGKSVILADFRNNFRELSKIEDLINQLRNDPNATIRTIVLQGFASPEGSYALNKRLAEERSQALKNYLQKTYSYPDGMFEVSSVPEDWDGLKSLVESSALSEKEAVLKIIDNAGKEDTKERELKSLKGGVYKELLQDYFPRLRRTDYKLAYVIRPFSVEEGKEIIQTKPQQLSLNEMFLVANTYPKGSSEFNNVFDIAARMFPAEPVVNINAAATALESGDTASAHRFLDGFRQVPASWNNQGVMYMLEGDFDQAKTYLTKAQEQGVSEAAQNLELLEQMKTYTEKMKAIGK